MPIAIIEGPPVDIDIRRGLVKEITEAMYRAYRDKDVSMEELIVIVHENPPERVARAGELISDRAKK